MAPSYIILFWLHKANNTIHKDHIEHFLTYINSIHPDIKWTKEEETEGKTVISIRQIRRQVTERRRERNVDSCILLFNFWISGA